MKIAIGNDHAGAEFKDNILRFLIDFEHSINDCGTNNTDPVDYPDYAHKVAKSVSDGTDDMGILVCGSGNGVCMAANKHNDVRAALCWNNDISELARLHNDANILAIPARFVSLEEAKVIITTFLKTHFEGGRHTNRVNKINI